MVSVTQMRIRGVLYTRRAIKIDVFTFLPLEVDLQLSHNYNNFQAVTT